MTVMISLGLIGTLFYFYIFNQSSNYFSNKDSKSIITITNSILVFWFCNAYLNNQISIFLLKTVLSFSIGFFLFDIKYLIENETKKEFMIRITHHSIAIIGIYLLNDISIIASKLFLTEIVNLPLEIRFISLRRGKSCVNIIKPICEIAIYVLFLFYRIIYPFKDYVYICSNKPLIYSATFTGLYILWIYWFVLINIKVFKIIKNILFIFKK